MALPRQDEIYLAFGVKSTPFVLRKYLRVPVFKEGITDDEIVLAAEF